MVRLLLPLVTVVMVNDETMKLAAAEVMHDRAGAQRLPLAAAAVAKWQRPCALLIPLTEQSVAGLETMDLMPRTKWECMKRHWWASYVRIRCVRAVAFNFGRSCDCNPHLPSQNTIRKSQES